MEREELPLEVRDLLTDGMPDTGGRKDYRWSLWIGGGTYGIGMQRSQDRKSTRLNSSH